MELGLDPEFYGLSYSPVRPHNFFTAQTYTNMWLIWWQGEILINVNDKTLNQV